MHRSTLNATAVATTLVLAAATLTPTAARANDSAIFFGAYGPQPLDVDGGRESPIRMVEEELVFHFGKWRTRVEVRFVFENTRADATVRQLSGFPDVYESRAVWPSAIEFMHEDAARFNAQYRHRSPLRNLETRIDGKPVDSPVRIGFVDHVDGIWSNPFVPVDTATVMSARWHVVELVIPPKGRLTLERRYDVRNGSNGLAYGAEYSYVTATGSSWHGTIGRLHATAFLEDGLTVEHFHRPDLVARDAARVRNPEDTDWTVVAPNRLELTWLDFEPRDDETRRVIGLAWLPLVGEYYPPWQIVRELQEPPEWDYPYRPPFVMPGY